MEAYIFSRFFFNALMYNNNDHSNSVKYNLKQPIYVGSQAEADVIYQQWIYESEVAYKSGKALPHEPIVRDTSQRPPWRDFFSLNPQKHLCCEILYPCGEIWEHYEFFDAEGNRIFFEYGYSFPKSVKTLTPEEAAQRVIDNAHLEEALDVYDNLDAIDQQPGMTDEEKHQEKLRYIRKQKKNIRRLVNLNQLYYMYGLSFAVELNENVKGLRFILSVEDQKDREKVLAVWNTRLTDIRRWMKKEGWDFRFVMVLERHNSEKTSDMKRYTYHLHLATDKPVNKHELQKHWGYGTVWIDNFKKKKVRRDGKWFNEDSEFINDPGRYISKYLDKEIDNPDFDNKHAYSSSRGNLKRPEQEKRRDSEEIQQLKANPEQELRRQGVALHPKQWEKIRNLKEIEEVKTFDNLERHGKLYEITIHRKNQGEHTEPLTMYMRYRVYNFRLLHPKAKAYTPKQPHAEIQQEFFYEHRRKAA